MVAVETRNAQGRLLSKRILMPKQVRSPRTLDRDRHVGSDIPVLRNPPQ